MKKITMLAIGLGLVLGSVSFAQDAPKMDDTKKSDTKKKKTKKAKKPATDTAAPADKKM